MRTASRTIRLRAADCEELDRMGLVETSGCCERCHSTERRFRGPCRATLADSGEAFVCCAARRQLLGRKGS